MIQYSSNISRIVRIKVEQMQQLQHPDQMLRSVALAVLPELRKRVHVDGKASDGSQIGTYSAEYMKLRTGNYGNSGRKTRGANKGQLKDAGTYTKGANQGAPRPKYNRTADPKVILSLTRQQENDLSVMPNGKGYAIGYNNPHNFDKSQWEEQTYRKPIWKLAEGELTIVNKVANDFVQETLNNKA